MKNVHDLHRDDGDAKKLADPGKLLLIKTISDITAEDVDRKPTTTPDPHPILRHPNLMPPTEFMALGMFPHNY